MTDFNYTITLSTETEALPFALPNGNSTLMTLKDEEGTKRRFVFATELWKALGSDKTKLPDQFLRSRHGKEQMIVRLEKAYKSEDLDIAENLSNIKTDDRESLPKGILDHFVLSTRGRNGGTWMEEDLFLTYAMWISPELHALAVDCLKRFGKIEAAPQNKQAELLIEEARSAATKTELAAMNVEVDFEDLNRKEKGKIIAKVSARMKQMEITGQVKELVKAVWGTNDARAVASIYSAIFGVINRTLLGGSVDSLAENLGVAKNSYTRDMLTSAALNSISMIEADLAIYLGDCIEDDVVPGLDELKAHVGMTAKRVRQQILLRGNRETRIIAENEKYRNTSSGNKGLYQVELHKNLTLNSLYKSK